MPHSEPVPIVAPSLVIVTGANGFIASHTINQLLDRGFRVIGTVRSQSKADAVSRTHAKVSNNAHLLSTAVVDNITDPNAYVDLFRETQPTAILHLASPFGYSVTNFETELLQPAVKGTEAVFHAAARTPSVRRIVHTNSFACIYDAALGPRPGHTYTSRDWCPLTYADGASAPNAALAYRASKTVAEKTAWDFMRRNPTPGFDLVSLCPAMVFGPFLATPDALPPSPAHLNTSNRMVWDIVSAGQHAPVPPTKGPVWVDVRDVAAAHVRALADPALAGRRLLLARGVYCNQEIADVARAVARKQSHRIPVGDPGRREADSHFGVDSSVEEKDLGFTWRSLEVCLADLLPQLYRIEEGVDGAVAS